MAETSHDAFDDLLPIGRFSALSRLSVRMLRHYDEHGVLTPARTDPSTGYRYYRTAQLRDAAMVRDLRDVGVGVSAIPTLLATRGNEQWRRALETQRAALREDLAAAQGRLTLIDRMISKEGPTMTASAPQSPASITIRRGSVPTMRVLALRGTVPTYADEMILWDRLMPLLTEVGAEPVGPGGVIEHVSEYVEHDVDLSVFVPVGPGTTAPAPVEVIDLPERECLIARVVGPYSLITAANDALAARLADGDLRLAPGDGPEAKGFNLYLEDADPAAGGLPVTEVCWPLSPSPAQD